MVKVIDIPDEDEPSDDVPVWEKTAFGERFMRELGEIPDDKKNFKFDVRRHRWRTW